MNPPDPRSAVLDVIRGTKHLGDLSRVGVLVQLTAPGPPANYTRKWTFQAPNNLEVLAKSSDVAQGIMNNLNDPSYIEDWASFLFAAPFIVFEFDEDKDGVPLADVLQDLSMGSMLSAPEIDKIKVLAES